MLASPKRAGVLWVLAAALAAAAAAGLVWLWLPHRAAAELAVRLAGERWYVVAFRDTPIGEFHTASRVAADGGFEFRTALRFALDGSTETRDEVRMVFDRWPPHALRRAEKQVRVGDATTEVVFHDGMATVVEDGRQRRLAADLDFRLADHLAVELWLETAMPAAGDRRAGRSLDLDRLSVTPVSWQLLERGADRVAVAGDWPWDARLDAPAAIASRLTLDPGGVPLRVEVADVLALERVGDAEAAAVWRREGRVFSAASMRVPADRPIAAPADLRALKVGVKGAAANRSAWPATLGVDLDAPRTPSPGEVAAASARTVRYPADDAGLRRLARQAIGDLEQPGARAAALTRFVHGHLRYQDSNAARTVLDTARDRTGDCTEYADLFTTLARSLDLPARTVVGLAYRADLQAFVLHAWNEVAIGERWRGMDPTWNQARLGASHMALPGTSALAAIAELPALRFRILETRY